MIEARRKMQGIRTTHEALHTYRVVRAPSKKEAELKARLHMQPRRNGKVVPEEGVEPTRPCDQRILSPPRLPFRHSGTVTVNLTY